MCSTWSYSTTISNTGPHHIPRGQRVHFILHPNPPMVLQGASIYSWLGRFFQDHVSILKYFYYWIMRSGGHVLKNGVFGYLFDQSPMVWRVSNFQVFFFTFSIKSNCSYFPLQLLHALLLFFESFLLLILMLFHIKKWWKTCPTNKWWMDDIISQHLPCATCN